MKNVNNLEQLESQVGKKNTKKILSLIKKFEEQSLKFSAEMNQILNPINHEMKVQVLFLEKQEDK